MKSVCGHFK
jgi:hypothetical protein